MREAKDAQNIFSAVLVHGARLSVRSGRPTRPGSAPEYEVHPLELQAQNAQDVSFQWITGIKSGSIRDYPPNRKVSEATGMILAEGRLEPTNGLEPLTC
jgi:hypothetical protein